MSSGNVRISTDLGNYKEKADKKLSCANLGSSVILEENEEDQNEVLYKFYNEEPR